MVKTSLLLKRYVKIPQTHRRSFSPWCSTRSTRAESDLFHKFKKLEKYYIPLTAVNLMSLNVVAADIVAKPFKNNDNL